MPSWVSNKGIVTPAQEDIYVDYGQSKFKSNKGRKSFHHKGPDRAAEQELKDAGVSHFGDDVTRNPDNIMRARNMNMNIDEYLKLHEPLTPAQVKAEEDKKNLVVDHTDPTPKPGVKPQGGGVTQSGALSDDMPV